jgi:hypothetical protein
MDIEESQFKAILGKSPISYPKSKVKPKGLGYGSNGGILA